MEDSWRKHVKVGIIQVMIFPDAPSGSARTLETARHIFLDDFFDVLFVGRMDGETAERVRGMAREAHASIGVGAAPVVLGGKHNLAGFDEEARRAGVEDLKRSIDQAYAMGAPVIELLDGARTYPGPEKEGQAVDQLVKSLVELSRYAEEKATGNPVWVLLETFDREVEKYSLVGPSDLAVEVARRVRAEQSNFGLTVDMGHVPLIGESYRQSLEATGEFLVHAHLGNCVRDDKSHPSYGDTHPPLGIPGGVADVPQLVEFLRALKGIGYFEKSLPTGMPWLTFEVKPQVGQSSDLVMANCRRAFKEAWAKI